MGKVTSKIAICFCSTTLEPEKPEDFRASFPVEEIDVRCDLEFNPTSFVGTNICQNFERKPVDGM
jgi:hypothetical protein